jgi:hypothetical protein
MGLVTAKEVAKAINADIRSSRYFLRLDADEGAKISTLNKVYDRINI